MLNTNYLLVRNQTNDLNGAFVYGGYRRPFFTIADFMDQFILAPGIPVISCIFVLPKCTLTFAQNPIYLLACYVHQGKLTQEHIFTNLITHRTSA